MKNINRKRFIGWALTIPTLLAIPAFFVNRSKKKKTSTVKMLTQDGVLVSIDVENIPKKKEKIDNNRIHTWINRKNSSL